MKSLCFALALFLVPVLAFADEDMLKMPYSVVLSYTDANSAAEADVASAENLMRRHVALPTKYGHWIALISFNSSAALRGKGPADRDLNRVYVSIVEPKTGEKETGYTTIFEGEFALQLGKKINVFTTKMYSVDLLITIPPDPEEKK